MSDSLKEVQSEIIRIKEAVKILKPLKNLVQHDLLAELEVLVGAFEKQPILETAKDVEEFKYRQEEQEGKHPFESIYSYEISIFGDRTNLMRLLGKLRNAILKLE